MRAVTAKFPSWGVDTISTLTSDTATALLDAGASFAVRYLGSLSARELAAILGTGMLVSLVTYADRFSGAETVGHLSALGVPPGVTVWLDCEGVAEDPTVAINAWARKVAAGGWQPGLYVGSASGLTAEQLYELEVVRYWRSMSFVPEPRCGFCLEQFPTTTVAGVSVDVDAVRPDYEGRMATFIGA